MKTIGQIQIDGIKSGLTNASILEMVLAQHPSANTTDKCVSWYRAKMKKASAENNLREMRRFGLEPGWTPVPQSDRTKRQVMDGSEELASMGL